MSGTIVFNAVVFTCIIDESIVSAAADVQTSANSPTAAHNSSTHSTESRSDAIDDQRVDPPNTAVSGRHNLIVLYSVLEACHHKITA